ncbi:MAG: tetratricopeptide repeat protein [Candidatus Competibacteraceae bacterium]|nr:tetratricopeptide repeat protein [Candidatus Competibacteraceae bacterium]
MRLFLFACLLWSAILAPFISAQAAELAASAGVGYLLDDAAAAVDQGHYDAAASALERALRIQPKNAEIWHLLGQVRLHQGRYSEAEAMGEKSSALAGNNPALQERNERLIRVARDLRGAPPLPNQLAGTAQPQPAPAAPGIDLLARPAPAQSEATPRHPIQADVAIPDSRARIEFESPEPLPRPLPRQPDSNEQTVHLIYDPVDDSAYRQRESSIRELDRSVPPAHDIVPHRRLLPADFLPIERLMRKLDRLRLDNARYRIEFRVNKPVKAKNNKHKKDHKKKHRKSQRRD